MNFDYKGQTVQKRSIDIDLGLRSYMMKVYNFMSIGLIISGLVAYFVSTNDSIVRMLFQTGLYWVVLFAPFLCVIFLSGFISKISPGVATAVFVGYAMLMGLTLSFIFLVYTQSSIVSVFAISACMFLGMSLYGYTAKRDLTSIGSFLVMGVFGLIISSVVNMFMKNGLFSFIISIVAVGIFTGLTAYDVQRIKLSYCDADENPTVTKKALIGALTLYLDFINIFIHMLHLFGIRKN